MQIWNNTFNSVLISELNKISLKRLRYFSKFLKNGPFISLTSLQRIVSVIITLYIYIYIYSLLAGIVKCNCLRSVYVFKPTKQLFVNIIWEILCTHKYTHIHTHSLWNSAHTHTHTHTYIYIYILETIFEKVNVSFIFHFCLDKYSFF